MLHLFLSNENSLKRRMGLKAEQLSFEDSTLPFHNLTVDFKKMREVKKDEYMIKMTKMYFSRWLKNDKFKCEDAR